jgi:isoleucyl-tRNA synthetase
VVINKHGADALRVYLISSPVVRAEPLKSDPHICALNMAVYVPSTWLYMCPQHGFICALNMAIYVP